VIGSVTDKFETGAAGWIHSLLLSEEEHCPLSDDPSVSLLVLRISERLGLAAEAVQDYELARDDEEDGESLKRRLEPVAVYLLGSAAFALTAIAHLTEEEDESSPTEHKDDLLEELDTEIAATIRTDYYLYDYEPGRILSLIMFFLTEACQCAIELEGATPFSGDEEPEDGPEGTLIQALWGTAALAAASAQFLIARSQE
jgi:hypothetical protein